MSDEAEPAGGDLRTGGAPRPMSKTPMFTARNSARYERQDLIKQIEGDEGTHLICYVGGQETQIDRDDLIGFVDMLHNIPKNQPVDLLLHTFGGDVDAAEKLIRLLQAHIGDADLRVIVPDAAKSAGTLFALGASTILMSDTSELGMIDPQFPMRDNQGNTFWHSVISYLAAYAEVSKHLAENHKDPVAQLGLDNFDAKVVHKFRGIEARVRRFAEDQLKLHGLPATQIAGQLLNQERWKTHGQPISGSDAIELGLPVQLIPGEDPRWARYWKLYCLQRLVIGEAGKIFESGCVSQVID